MNLPIDTCENGACSFAIRGEYDKRVYAKNLGLGGGHFPSTLRRCAWCINCTDGCARTVLAHYHKAGARNLIGETFLTQETGVIEIWEV